MEFRKNDKDVVDTSYIINRSKTVDPDITKTFADRKWVWIPDPEKCFIPGHIVKEENNLIHVNVNSEIKIIKETDILKMNPPKFDLVEDLAALSHLNEPSVLHNLVSRYQNNLIYTYSGLFLLAVNPYRDLKIYSEKYIKKYAMNKKNELDPHIYGVANEAYNNMLNNKENQSILITGESGAGKTENTKKVIEFLASIAGFSDKKEEKIGINRNYQKSSPFDKEYQKSSTIDKKIIMTNPILEAFGNAKTVKNDNSSRFGKFIQIKFNGGNICGAFIEKYLLEKSRITNQNSDERNYHIFYQLLKTDDDTLKKQLFLDDNIRNYRFLQGVVNIEGIDDQEDFKNLRRSFRDLNISENVELFYYKIVAAVLHLGNLQVIEKNGNVEIENFLVIDKICKLLEIPSSQFINSLLHPVIKAGNEFITQSRSKEQVYSIIDALAKILYDKMFDQIINELNNKLGTSDSTNFIGVLDIAGFEIFKENGFEQLCINYTNEKLQQFFNHHMFILEQEIYRKENIDWNFIDFGLDLQPTIDLIEKNNPIGILSYLDEECVMPQASDKTFLNKLKSIKNQKFKNVYFKEGFILEHYAGQVEYLVNNWITKNKDPNFEDINELINKSGNLNVSNLSFIDKNIKRGFFRTVGQKHKEQLNSLMKTLFQTNPHFVRCIIPNLKKSPNHLDNKLILEQLKCNGVLEGIRISRQGYPSRMSYSEFAERYKIFNQNSDNEGKFMDKKEESVQILNNLNLSDSQYKCGISKIFFRQGVLADIEDLRDIEISKIMKQIQVLVRAKLDILKANLDEHRRKAVSLLKKNAKICIDLQKWNWWKLYLKIKPLLDVRKRDNELKEKDRTIENYMKNIEDLQSKIEKLKGMNNQLSQQKENLIKEIEMEKIHIMENDELIKGIRNQSKEVEKEKSDLNNKIKSLIKEFNKEKEEIIKNLNNEKNQKINLEEKLKDLEDKKLQSANDEVKNLKNISNELKDENKKLVAENISLEKNKEYLESKIQELQDQIEKLNQELQDQAENLKIVTNNLEIYKINFKKIKEENNDLIFENENLEKNQVKLEKDLEIKNENLLKSIEDNKNLKSDLNVLKLDQNLNLKKIKNLEEQIQELEKSFVNTEKVERNNLQSEKLIKKLKDKLDFYINSNNSLRQEMDDIRENNNLLTQTRMDEFFEGERKFEIEKKSLKREIQKLTSENSNLKKELYDLKATSESSEDSTLEKLYLMLDKEKKLRRDLEGKILEYESKNLNLQNIINDLNKCTCTLNDYNSDNYNSENNVCNCKCTSCNESCRLTYKNINNPDYEEIEKIVDSVNILVEGFNTTFYNILNNQKERINSLLLEIKDLKDELANSNISMAKYESEIKNINALYSELQDTHNNILKKLQSISNNNENYLSKISQLEIKNQEKENIINVIKEKYEDLLSTVERIQSDTKKESERSLTHLKNISNLYDTKIREITELKDQEILNLKTRLTDLEKSTILDFNKCEIFKFENTELKKRKDIKVEPLIIQDSHNYLVKIQDLERKKLFLEKEIKNIKNKDKEYQIHFEKFKKENGELKKDIENLKEVNFDLLKSNNMNNILTSQMTRDLQDSKEMIDFLKNISLVIKRKK